MKYTLLLAAALAFTTPASAAVLFADDFQTNLSQWGTIGSAVIVAAPGGGNALSFTGATGGGDLFGASGLSASGGNFHISFDYLGTCDPGVSCGGFVGFNNPFETWLAGSGNYPTANPIAETGAWQTVSFDFSSASPITLKLEDFSDSGDNGVANNVFFRNLVLSDSVPEPATWALLVVGFGMIGAAARRRAGFAVN